MASYDAEGENVADDGYRYKDVPLGHIRNRNEQRVIELLPVVLAEFADYRPDYLDVQDIYALTLNNLPPRYVQRGTLVLNEPVSDEDILRELRLAIEKVEVNPITDKK